MKRHIDPLTLKAFVSIAELEEMTGLSRTTIWRMERDGSLPKIHQISPGRRAFLKSDIDKWISAKTGAADAS
jgi:prophage regulatory protein